MEKSRWVASAFAAGLIALAAQPVLAQTYRPSPDNWADEIMYQVLTDRFFDGDPSNNTVGTQFNPSAGNRSHGGDWDGIRMKIPYLKALGVTALWISPHVLNVNGAYHGYHAQDFTAAAPNFGGQAALDRLRDDLRTSGIRLVLDVVPNHGGDLINNNPWLPPPGFYNLSYRNNNIRHAPPFQDLDCWHAHGTTANFFGLELILGELANLDDLKTERADIRTTITQIFADWITRTDACAFRIDTVKHVDMPFWQYFANEIRSHAATLGKENFFQFGEVLDGFSPFVGSFTGTRAGGPFALDSVIDYPLYFRTNDVFARQTAGAQSIMDYYGWQVFDYDPASIGLLVTNLDNHDQPRFLHSSLANDNRARLRAALAFQILSPGVPSIYYGTEQWFNGGNDPFCREDMFDGQFEFGPSLGDNFHMSSDGFLWMRRLTELRRNLPALRRGTIVGREARNTPGPFAFSRIMAGEPEVLVAINTSDQTRTAGTWLTNYQPGTQLVDALEEAFSITVGSGGSVSGLTMSGNQVRVLIPPALVPDWEPSVINTSIPHGSRPSSQIQPLVIEFSEPLTTATVTAALTTTPTQPGLTAEWNSQGTQLTLRPGFAGWTPAANNLLRIGLLESVTDLTGQSLRGGYELLMDFNASAPPLSLSDPTVDGTLGTDPRYSAGELSVQTVQTQFGNNTNPTPDGNSGGSELNNLYMYETTGTLYLGLGGNLEPNGNAIVVLFDLDGSAATGATQLNATGATSNWLAGNQGARNTIMPANFGADVAVVVSAGGGASLSLWVYRWGVNGVLAEERFFGTVNGTPGQATRGRLEAFVESLKTEISLALDNSHTGPVGSGTGLANPNGSGAQTGLELALPRTLVGGDQNRRFFAAITGSTGFWSNQFLPPGNAGANAGNAPNLSTRGIVPFLAPAIPVTLSGFALDE
jgi:glycosidase